MAKEKNLPDAADLEEASVHHESQSCGPMFVKSDIAEKC
jgi:hypothetical protein